MAVTEGERDNGKENGNYHNRVQGLRIVESKMGATIVHWGYMRIMEKKIETTIVNRGYMGIMEKKIETTIVH